MARKAFVNLCAMQHLTDSRGKRGPQAERIQLGVELRRK